MILILNCVRIALLLRMSASLRNDSYKYTRLSNRSQNRLRKNTEIIFSALRFFFFLPIHISNTSLYGYYTV